MKTEKEIWQKMHELNRTLVAIAEFDYPVYLLHLEMKKPNNDPMYFIDWAIMHFVKSQPDIDKKAVACLLGLESSLIEYRIRCLCEGAYLIPDQNGYNVAPKAESFYFIENGEIPYINDSKDLLIDGITLRLMNERFYKDSPFVKFWGCRIQHKIIKGVDDHEIRKSIDKIERLADGDKKKYGLPERSKEYSSVDDPEVGCVQLSITFSIDEKGGVHKDIVYQSDFVSIPSLLNKNEGGNGFLNKFCFYFYKNKLYSNDGYNDRDEEESAKRILNLNKDDIQTIAEQLFGWKDIKNNEYHLIFDSEIKQRPLTYLVSIDRLKNSKKVRPIINALKQGYIKYPKDDNNRFCIFVSVITNDEEVAQLVEFDNTLNECFQKKDAITELNKFFMNHDYRVCRENMILLQRYKELEEMDCTNFMNKGI